jgi:hypothetical protein
MSDKIPYDATTYLVLCGNYDCLSSFCKIIDRINLNGCTGHSFRILINQDKKNILTAGGFDGDGADRIDFIAFGGNDTDEGVVDFNRFKSSCDYLDLVYDKGVGNCLAIARGSKCGIDSILKILKTVVDLVTVSGNDCKVVTDDSPSIELGTYGGETWDQQLGFIFNTVKDGDYSNPLKFFSDNGYTLSFFRGRL